MKECGETSVCLGLEIRRDGKNKSLHLSQKRYAENVLQRFEMAESKPVVTPMNGQLELSDLEGDPLTQAFAGS